MDERTRTEIEAAVYRRLRDHLQKRTDVQNIDMMNQSGFCRNCLSRWYAEAAETHGISLDKPASRAIVYGMPFDEWKDLHQLEATEEQRRKFAESQEHSH
ncbi:MAG: DUF1244 domain-containing protein [Rhodobacteraceae bacterium]|nr:DUF1244 domain-containing protein [Paracoccaceae bacterium]